MDQERSNLTRTPRQLSPYLLMQERYRDDPWALLVGCILFNMVHGSKASPVLERFLERWPTASDLIRSNVPLTEIEEVFKPLGFQKRRSERIWKMSLDFICMRPDIHPDAPVEDLYGIGKYGADSFNIFVRGYLVKDAQDKELRKYVQWAQNQPEGAGESLWSTARQTQA